MEDLDDRWYLTDPNDREFCELHGWTKPCWDCQAEYEEWEYEAKRETT